MQQILKTKESIFCAFLFLHCDISGRFLAMLGLDTFCSIDGLKSPTSVRQAWHIFSFKNIISHPSWQFKLDQDCQWAPIFLVSPEMLFWVQNSRRELLPKLDHFGKGVQSLLLKSLLTASGCHRCLTVQMGLWRWCSVGGFQPRIMVIYFSLQSV